MNILVVGGAGFIGSHVVDYYARQNNDVVIIDNLSRKKTECNIAWLQQKYSNIEFVKGDIKTDTDMLNRVVGNADVVFHFAAQVAVTTSVSNPREDFETNLVGTMNVLEAARNSAKKPIIIYSSTNKVYGSLEDVAVVEETRRYSFPNHTLGINESRPLDFHSPYGCSKGAADQYVRDYHRIYGLRTIVFRQSCIYGDRQYGCEDQGWVAWFVIAALTGQTITIYGNGKQTRDLLFIDDLCDAYWQAINNIDRTAGRIYNIGGGHTKTLSLLELVTVLERKLCKTIPVTFSKTRHGDQPIYISDVRKAASEFGWSPSTSVQQGLEKIIAWTQKEFKYDFA